MLWLVGLGLGSRGYVTEEAWRAMRGADAVYLDAYTSFVEDGLLDEVRRHAGGRLVVADRHVLEDRSREIVSRAASEDVVVAVPGDPLIATTHSSLIVEAARSGVPWRIVHGVSIFSAAISRAGLSPYRFGRTVTLPRDAEDEVLRGIWRTIAVNSSTGLHTMLLLDTAGGGLTAGEASEMLLGSVDSSEVDEAVRDPLVVYCARLGMSGERVGVARLSSLRSIDLPPPPHVLLVPSKLGPGERDFVRHVLKSDEEPVTVSSPVHVRAARYVAKARSALSRLEVLIDTREVRRALDHAANYVSDAENFLNSGREEDALVAVSYAEGILDALRLLGAVRFEW
ncbi:MAG: diphthine synthase [Thaumarchaeota archaeon]|nr:diphthine synthase [Candidatus Calditenuaceae archaeon]MCX8203602.1 diphthine synthase [Nitrososphaeria archaeon]MDW8043184.1 diphthine synthase [Nitrososphaerota archaeon]